MKARKKGTNDEWQEVDFVQLVNSYVITPAEQMEFDIPSNDYTKDDHWQDVRERVAIVAMHVSLDGEFEIYNEERVAQAAVKYADALVTELKKKALNTNSKLV